MKWSHGSEDRADWVNPQEAIAWRLAGLGREREAQVSRCLVFGEAICVSGEGLESGGGRHSVEEEGDGLRERQSITIWV